MLKAITTIRLSKDTKSLLDQCGNKSESYDNIILRLIERTKLVGGKNGN